MLARGRPRRADPARAGAGLPRVPFVRAPGVRSRSGRSVVEHDILAALHSSDSGYERFANEWTGERREFLPFQPVRSA